jgi:Fe-S-cluster containining protein
VAASGDVNFDCRCGECYRRLLIEVLVEDALVEPKIAEKGSPLLDPPDASGHWEVIGYLLNGKDGPCVFLEPLSNLCTIYATPPMVCRLVDFRRRP